MNPYSKMKMIEKALTRTTDTKACEIGPGAAEAAAWLRTAFFAIVSATAACAAESAIDISTGRQLMVDDYLIESTNGRGQVRFDDLVFSCRNGDSGKKDHSF